MSLSTDGAVSSEAEKQEVLRKLYEIPNPTERNILVGPDSFSVADLINDVREGTPRGEKFVRLHFQAVARLARLVEEKASNKRARVFALALFIVGLVVIYLIVKLSPDGVAWPRG